VAELVRELDVGFTGFRHPAILPDDAARRMPIGRDDLGGRFGGRLGSGQGSGSLGLTL
jgi:hypothetical protein